MIFTIDIGKGARTISRDLTIGRYAEELYKELNRCNMIARLNDIPLLGPIFVKKKNRKSRMDYITLQLYIHNVIKEKNAHAYFQYTYNSSIFENDCIDKIPDTKGKKKPSILDAVQIMILVSNIGYSQNTFSAAQGILRALRNNDSLLESFLREYKDTRGLVEKVIKEDDYRHFPICIALLMLEQCNEELYSVQLAKVLIEYYLIGKDLPEKIEFVFDLFRNGRSMTFYIYDLPVSTIPLYMDISDENSIVEMFREIQGRFNDNSSARNLFDSVIKLLDDSVYYEQIDTIRRYRCITRKIEQKLENEMNHNNFLSIMLEPESILNMSYPKKCDFCTDNILKLTLNKNEVEFEKLFSKIEHMSHVRCAYYNRGKDEKTLLVALSRKKDIKTSFRVMKLILQFIPTSYLGNNCEEKEINDRVIVTAKFFLHNLFSPYKVTINPTHGITAYASRGCCARLRPLQKAIKNSAEDDFRHELEFICNVLGRDRKNDLAVVIGGSVQLKENVDGKLKCVSEYDGLVIFSNRNDNQIVFFEAKNREYHPSEAKNALIVKFNKIDLDYCEDEFVTENKDCSYTYTL